MRRLCKVERIFGRTVNDFKTCQIWYCWKRILKLPKKIKIHLLPFCKIWMKIGFALIYSIMWRFMRILDLFILNVIPNRIGGCWFQDCCWFKVTPWTIDKHSCDQNAAVLCRSGFTRHSRSRGDEIYAQTAVQLQYSRWRRNHHRPKAIDIFLASSHPTCRDAQ